MTETMSSNTYCNQGFHAGHRSRHHKPTAFTCPSSHVRNRSGGLAGHGSGQSFSQAALRPTNYFPIQPVRYLLLL